MKNIFWKCIYLRRGIEPNFPWYMGMSYYNVARNDIYLTVIPLNIIIRGVIKFYNWIKYGK